MKSYVAPVQRLLGLLLRSSEEQVPPLRALVDKYKESSERLGDTDDREEAVENLFLILLFCWTRQWLPTENDLFPDPTLRSIAYGSVRFDGTFKEAKDTTGDYAKLSYVLRLILLYAMHKMSCLTLSEACDHYSPFYPVRSALRNLCGVRFCWSFRAFLARSRHMQSHVLAW